MNHFAPAAGGSLAMGDTAEGTEVAVHVKWAICSCSWRSSARSSSGALLKEHATHEIVRITDAEAGGYRLVGMT